MRQRYLDLDELTRQAKQQIEASGMLWREFQDLYDISWIYHENGLEGVVLGYPEIRSAADKQVVSDVSLLPRYRDIAAQKRCIEMMREKAKLKRAVVTLGELQEMHGLLLNDPEKGGEYRKDIPIHRTYFHTIAHPSTIEQGLRDVLDFLNSKRDDKVHPIEFAADLHFRFMAVFPFSKQSGTIGRFLLNYLLLRLDYIPAVIHATDRQQYYEALRGGTKDFRIFLCETMETGLENTRRLFSRVESQAVVS